MNFSELAATQETAERALRESEARFRQLLEHAPSAIFAKDRDGRYLWVSREFERLVGARADQIVGHTDAEIFGPTMAALFRKNDLRVMLEGRPLEFEETGQFVQGTRTYLTSKFPLFNEQGEPYAVCGLATDITARKRIGSCIGQRCARGVERSRRVVVRRLGAVSRTHSPSRMRVRCGARRRWFRTAYACLRRP